MDQFTVRKLLPRKRESSLSWLLLLSLFLGVNAAQAQQFPYVAYVTGEQAYVRSGPGQRYYPTGQLSEGHAVEVYRHDEGGWCAIRPLESSFSWVPSHQVRRVDDRMVEILADQVVARVGSTLSPDRSAVQVLLPKGEHLAAFATDINDDPRWVRIAAPAGEFRWIAASSISLQPPLETTPAVQAEQSGWTRQTERSAETEANAFSHLDATVVNSQSGLQFAPPNTLPQQSAEQTQPVVNPTGMEVVAGSPAELQLAQFQGQGAAVPPPALLTKGNPVPTPAAQQSSQPRVRFDGSQIVAPVRATSVEELELKLSQAVVESPEKWQLAPLEAEADRLLKTTKAPAVRAQLRELVVRIDRFQQVQNRYNNPPPIIITQQEPTPAAPTLASRSGEAVERSSELTGLSSEIRERVQEDFREQTDRPRRSQAVAAADKPLYDAAGLLKPVVSKRENAPEYALVDQQGKVVSFVTPTPDLNLKPYVGKRVGVHGTRGFMPEYRRTHVTAGRVTPIDGAVRR